MAVEIAKESSDMFLPLKAVVGALSVLIKNYDVSTPKHLVLLTTDRFLQQTTANAEQIRDIEERVQSLVRYSHPRWVTRTVKRRRGERLYGSSYPPQETLGTSLNRIDYSQEVGWDYCKARTAVRTTWACEVLEER
jgi:hypothetical protein